MSITDVTSSAIGAWSAARCAGVDQYGHVSTLTFNAASALAPHNANAEVTPHGRPAISSVAMFTAARPMAGGQRPLDRAASARPRSAAPPRGQAPRPGARR